MAAQLDLNKFEEEFVYKEDKSRYTLISLPQKKSVFVGKALWDVCSKLDPERSDQKFQVQADESSIEALCVLNSTGKFPNTFFGLIAATAAANELGAKDLLSQCFYHYITLKQFHDSDYPIECSENAILGFFNALCDQPLRSQDIYHKELSRLKAYSQKNTSVMSKAIAILKTRISQNFEINLGALDVPFDCTTIPIAIARIDGEFKQMAFIKETWQNVNWLGAFVPIETLEHSRFSLFWGSCVYFKDHDCVYKKKLNSEAPVSMQLTNCKDIFTRGKHFFALQVEAGSKLVNIFYLNKHEFISIYSTSNEIKRIDYSRALDCVGILEKMASGKTQLVLIRLDSAQPLAMISTQSFGSIVDFSFHKQFVILKKQKQKHAHNYLLCNVNLETQELLCENKWKTNFAFVFSIADTIFAFDGEKLNVYRNDNFVPIDQAVEFKALTELELVP